MCEYDCNKVESQLTRNTIIGCDTPKALMTMDPYNSLGANIHKDVVGFGGVFILVIDSWHDDHSENDETILGRSQTI